MSPLVGESKELAVPRAAERGAGESVWHQKPNSAAGEPQEQPLVFPLAQKKVEGRLSLSLPPPHWPRSWAGWPD